MSKIFKILFLFLSLFIGFAGGIILSSYISPRYGSITTTTTIHNTSTKSCIEGYYFRNTTEPQFDYGDWVCVNVEGLSFKRGLEVCKHEVFHEIWAECGENNNLSYCISQYEIESELFGNFSI